MMCLTYIVFIFNIYTTVFTRTRSLVFILSQDSPCLPPKYHKVFGFFPSGFLIKILYKLSIRATHTAHDKLPDLIILNIFVRRDHDVPYTIFSIHLLHLSPHVPITSLQLRFQMPSPSLSSPKCQKPSPLHTQWQPQTSIGCLYSSMIISKRCGTKRSCTNNGAAPTFTSPDCEKLWKPEGRPCLSQQSNPASPEKKKREVA